MTYQLTPLPYALDALEPYISKETLRVHYHKHHQGYVDKLNELIAAHPEAKMPLEELLVNSSGVLFNNAAQVWNHDFFWKCLTPEKNLVPEGRLAEMIHKKWNGLENFKTAFSDQAANHFGSGWTWLVLRNEGLEIVSTTNAYNPVVIHAKALLTIDLWEHAYYLDVQNDRQAFIAAFWEIVNWKFVSERLDA